MEASPQPIANRQCPKNIRVKSKGTVKCPMLSPGNVTSHDPIFHAPLLS